MVQAGYGRTGRVVAGVLFFVLYCAVTVGAVAAPVCKAPDSVAYFSEPIPGLAKVFKSDKIIRIVAFGSSSTSGAGASAADKTYPARLQAGLNARFKGRVFEVVNRGRSGEFAAQMLARLERDVLAMNPALVIWQTGVNDALRKVDPDAFRRTVEMGLAQMNALGIDVILLDQQFFPGSVKVAGYQKYLDLIRDIGAAHGVPVFKRYKLMAHLVESAQFTIDELLASDQFHLNDTSYDCLGNVLAGAISASLPH